MSKKGLACRSLAPPESSHGVDDLLELVTPEEWGAHHRFSPFPLNRGLGNNPTDRDAYIRYNLTNNDRHWSGRDLSAAWRGPAATSYRLAGKWVEVLREIAAHVTRVAAP
jgi:hypothetical protein